MVAGLPLTTLGLAWVTQGRWVARILVAQALVVFWATVPDAEFLPARWLVYAALVAEACTFLEGWWRLGFSLAFLGELVLVQNGIPGMTTPAPPWGTTALVVGLTALVGILLDRVQRSRAEVERLAGQNRQLHGSVMQLTSANSEFLEQANTAGEESAVQERNRITRELHDVVGQTLTNIIMMMDAALHRKAHDPEETTKLLRWIRRQAQTGLEETRAVLYELRALRPSSLRGLKALKKLIETFGRLSRIKTRVEWGNLPWTFDPDQENAVYHLVQGALSNAFRHGLATQVDIHFQVDRGQLNLMIRDNGRGGPDASLGLGQRGMEERLARWNGTVTFKSEPYGYMVLATLPLQTTDLEEATRAAGQDSDRR